MLNRERFIEVYKTLGKESIREFSRMLDFSEDNVGNYINGTTKNIPFSVFEKIKKTFPQINSDWLLLGEGEMLKGDTINPNNNDDSSNHIQADTIKKNKIAYADRHSTASIVEDNGHSLSVENLLLKQKIDLLEKENAWLKSIVSEKK